MYVELQRRGRELFGTDKKVNEFCKEWNEMRKMFGHVEWVKKYEKGVKVVNS